jgi:hypothetical protein
MSTIPTTLAEKLAFFEQHLPIWAVDPLSIGLSAAQVATLTSMVVSARSTFDFAGTQRAASRAATNDQTIAFSAMTDLGGDLIKTIRAFAETNDDPNVYSAAQIPPPAPPSPPGPPALPTALKAKFMTPFGIRLDWKGSIAQGTYFAIFRQVAGETAFTNIQTTRDKFYEDLSLPGGIDAASYYIAAFRDGEQVNSTTLALQFGPGGMTSMTLAA